MRSSFKRHIEKSIEKCKIVKPVDKKINFILPDHGAAAAAATEDINTNPEPERVLVEQPLPGPKTPTKLSPKLSLQQPPDQQQIKTNSAMSEIWKNLS